MNALSARSATAAAAARLRTVVVLNDFCHVQGGASKVAIDEAVALAGAGMCVIFVGAVGPVCAALSHAPLTVHCLAQRELSEAGRNPLVAVQALWNTAAQRAVTSLLRTLDPSSTILHVHGYTKALTTSPLQAARAAGFRIVCTLHDFFAACPNGAFFDYKRQAPCSRRALSPSCLATQCDKRNYGHKLYRVGRSLVQRHAGAFPGTADNFIALSAMSTRLLAPYLPPNPRIHALGNIIDVARGEPVDVASNRAILCVGRLDIEKGVLLLASAAARSGMCVTFVGDGPLRGEIERIPGMTVTGWLSGTEVQRCLGGARCLVFPSLWFEAYGLVVAEAAARGIPAIVSDISAAAERVADGVSGWHFRSGNQADLARCLSMPADDAAVRAAGRAAYERFWSDPPSRENHALQLLGIYDAILSSASPE